MPATTRQDVTFTSGGERIAAWWYQGGPGRRSCVVMAHGFSGTKRCGLEPYAQRFAAEGHHVLVIDYRHFGDSGGLPRQMLDPRRQVEDVLAATQYARSRADVDPDQVAMWGTSFGGGVVLVAAVRDGRVAAVVSQCPALDGWAGLARALTQPGQSVTNYLRILGLVSADLVAAALGRDPVMVPSVGPPGSVAVMTAVDAEPGFRRIAGPDWENAVCARVALAVLRFRPVRQADRVPCPWLVQICRNDTVAPISSAERAARRAGPRATVRHYDTGHFGIYVNEDFERSVADQVAFVNQHLTSAGQHR